MSDRIVVVGASAGGIDALRVLAAGLPSDFPSPVVAILHMSPESPASCRISSTASGPLRASHGT
jgi:two-component system chemotaxis response regulator CheB